MKKLQYYYYHVGIPVLLVLMGTLVFFPEIMNTVKGNPHPQINYMIFLLIGAGCVQMLMHVRRINLEGVLLQEFFNLLIRDKNRDGAEKLIRERRLKGKSDVVDVLHLILSLTGQMIGPVQHSAVELEVERFQATQARRLLLSQFMAGMMVGLGLLGTFIGLLGALDEIGKLIGSFSIGSEMVDPVSAIGELVTRLTTPMQAMGVAFSASLFGVLGSLIMGVLMVSVRSAAGDLVSLVQSRVTLAIDTSGTDDSANNFDSISHALSELAQHSPILQGLALALDQSERRVREIVQGVSQLTARVDANTQANSQVFELLRKSAQTQAQTMGAVEKVQQDFEKLLHIQTATEHSNSQVTQAIVQQQLNIEDLIRTHSAQSNNLYEHHASLTQQQEILWQEHMTILRTEVEQQHRFLEETFKQNENALALDRKFARTQMAVDRESWSEQFDLQETALEQTRQQAREQVQVDRSMWEQQTVQREQELALTLKSMSTESNAERKLLMAQSQIWSDSSTRNYQSMQVLFDRLDSGLVEQTSQWMQLQTTSQQDQRNTVQLMREFSDLMIESSLTLRSDSLARTEFATQFHMYVTESQTRQEQLMHVLTVAVAQVNKTS